MMLDHLSYSSIKLFNSCARQWQLRYLSDVKPAMPITVNLGSRFHGFAEEYGAHCRAKGLTSDLSWARSYGCQQEDSELAALVMTFAESYTFEAATHRGRGQSEIVKRVKLGDGLPDFVAKIDDLRLYEDDLRLKVTDYKTPWSSEWYASDAPPWQLMLYGWVAQETEGALMGLGEDEFLAVDLAIWNVPRAEEYLWQIVDDLSYTVKPQVVQAARRILGAIEAEDFPANPHAAACTYCPYSYQCRAAQGLSLTAPTSTIEAKVIAAHLEALEANVAQLKAGLQGWATERGPVQFEQREWGYFRPRWYEEGEAHATPSDAQALWLALQEAGKDPLEYVTGWDADKLGYKFCREDKPDSENPFGDTEDDLAVRATVKQYLTVEQPKPRWGSRKLKGG